MHKDIFAQGGWAVEKEAIMPMVRSQLQEWNREELRKRAREIQDLSRPRILNNQSNLQNYNELIQHLLSGAMNGKISPSQAQETEALISMTLELNPILERGFMMKLHEIMAPNKPAKLLSLVGDDSELDNESRGNTQANDECQVLRITPPIEDRHKPMVPTTPTQSFDSQSADQQERQEISESPAWRIGLRVADRQFSIDLSGSPARIIDQEMTDRHSAVDMGLETTGDDDNRTADVHDPVWDMDEPIMQSIEQDTPEPGKTLLQSLERYERAFRRCKLRNSPTGNAEKAVEETGKTEMKEKTFMRRSESGSLFGEESESKRTTNCREEKKGAVKVELLKPELTGEVTVEVMDGERESTKNKKKRRRGTSEAALAEADMEIREQGGGNREKKKKKTRGASEAALSEPTTSSGANVEVVEAVDVTEEEGENTKKKKKKKRGASEVALPEPKISGGVVAEVLEVVEAVEVMEEERGNTMKKKTRKRRASKAALSEADMEIKEKGGENMQEMKREASMAALPQPGEVINRRRRRRRRDWTPFYPRTRVNKSPESDYSTLYYVGDKLQEIERATSQPQSWRRSSSLMSLNALLASTNEQSRVPDSNIAQFTPCQSDETINQATSTMADIPSNARGHKRSKSIISIRSSSSESEKRDRARSRHRSKTVEPRNRESPKKSIKDELTERHMFSSSPAELGGLSMEAKMDLMFRNIELINERLIKRSGPGIKKETSSDVI